MNLSMKANKHPIKVCLVSPLPPPFAGMTVLANTLKASLENEGVFVKTINTNPVVPYLINKVQLSPIFQYIFFIINLYKIIYCNAVIIISSSGKSFYLKVVPTLLVSKILRKKIILDFVGGGILDNFNRFNIFLFKLFPHILVPTTIFKNAFNQRGIKCDVFPHIVDINRFQSEKYCSDNVNLLSVKTLDKYSCINDIIMAYSIVKRTFPNATLTITGDGPEKKNLQKLIIDLSLSGIHFTGNIQYDAMPSFYKDASILIHATQIESFGIALVEAMASGTPVVSTNVGGIPEVIDDTVNGYLVNHGDYTAMADKILLLLNDEKLYNRISRNAIKKASQYGPKVLSKRLINLITETL